MKAVFEKVASARGIELAAFDAIQPQIDATSSLQIGEGGWVRVKVWLEDNAGLLLKDVLTPKVFSASQSYDILLIHLDGDVVSKTNMFSSRQKAICFQNPAETVRAVESLIYQTLEPPEDLDDSIVYVVPVLQTESWLLAASVRGAVRLNLEVRELKAIARRYLPYRYGLDLRGAAEQAARQLGERLGELRQQFQSLEHLAKKLDAALQ